MNRLTYVCPESPMLRHAKNKVFYVVPAQVPALREGVRTYVSLNACKLTSWYSRIASLMRSVSAGVKGPSRHCTPTSDSISAIEGGLDCAHRVAGIPPPSTTPLRAALRDLALTRRPQTFV